MGKRLELTGPVTWGAGIGIGIIGVGRGHGSGVRVSGSGGSVEVRGTGAGTEIGTILMPLPSTGSDGGGRGSGRDVAISAGIRTAIGTGAGTIIGTSRGSGIGSASGSSTGGSIGDGIGAGYAFIRTPGNARTVDVASSGTGVGHDEDVLRLWLDHIADKLTAQFVIRQQGAEVRRLMIEAMGIDRFCSELDGEIIDEDKDRYGNPRKLLRFEMPETRNGYFQAVQVVCPTTDRVYHLGVESSVETCQEAVASTFGLSADEYNPDRES